MPARLFVGYFLVLAACATLAFGSSWMTVPAASADPEPQSSAPAAFHSHHKFAAHSRTVWPAQVALTN